VDYFGTSVDDYHDEVSGFLSDICGFTQLASQKSLSDTVQLLNRVFLARGDLVERYNREGRPVEKIKTMGDSYMAVADPDGRPDHGQIALDLATDMIRADSQSRTGGRLTL
jgi:class 3 adenylate cyclase